MGADYADEALPELLLEKRGEAHPTERADLYGKRMVSTIEVEQGRRMAESMTKQLTGGDRIKARRMKEDPWSFPPTHKIFLAANHRPEIRGTDTAIWSRIHMIPFSVSFLGHENLKLAEELATERAGILAWMVRGCIEWQLQGLNPPAEVLAATEAYRADSDSVADFLTACCVIGINCRAKAAELYEAFVVWHRGTVGGEPIKGKQFGLYLSERFEKKREESGIWYLGLGLRS